MKLFSSFEWKTDPERTLREVAWFLVVSEVRQLARGWLQKLYDRQDLALSNAETFGYMKLPALTTLMFEARMLSRAISI